MLQRSELAYDTFWYMVNERHRIYLNRKEGRPKPWSEDPIFQQWKFCNIFRSLDRQSQYLIQNVIEPHKEDNLGLLLFNIFAFRAFNLWDTYEAIVSNTTSEGWITKWNEKSVQDIVCQLDRLTSGAYMIRGFEAKPKWQSIPETLTRIWRDKDALASAIYKMNHLEYACDLLQNQKYWGWGPFTCYQIGLDLTYTPILENPKDINTWCEFGPGAKRGIEIIYPGIKSKDYLPMTKKLLVDSLTEREEHVPVMNLQDIEFSLCEFQKYWRIHAGGRGKEKFIGA